MLAVRHSFRGAKSSFQMRGDALASARTRKGYDLTDERKRRWDFGPRDGATTARTRLAKIDSASGIRQL